jgi:hypothetical protein
MPDPGSRVKKIPRSRIRIKKNLSIFIQKVASNLSDIWSGMFIQNPDIDFYPSPTVSRDQKVTGSRIRIRNTAGNRFCVVTTNLGNWWPVPTYSFHVFQVVKFVSPKTPWFVTPPPPHLWLFFHLPFQFCCSFSSFGTSVVNPESCTVLWIRPFLSIRIRIRLWILTVEKDSRGINPLPM